MIDLEKRSVVEDTVDVFESLGVNKWKRRTCTVALQTQRGLMDGGFTLYSEQS